MFEQRGCRARARGKLADGIAPVQQCMVVCECRGPAPSFRPADPPLHSHSMQAIAASCKKVAVWDQDDARVAALAVYA